MVENMVENMKPADIFNKGLSLPHLATTAYPWGVFITSKAVKRALTKLNIHLCE